MSVRVMTLVWDASFPTPTAKLIALKLADCANDDGANVFPSRRTIERATMCSSAAVKKWLVAFEKTGLLIVDRRSAGGARRDTTVRRFNMPLLRALACGTKRFGGSSSHIAIVDAAGGHVVAGPWDDPATTYPIPGHVVADTGPPSGPNPSTTRQTTVKPPQSPAMRGRARGRRCRDDVEQGLDAARIEWQRDPAAVALIDDLLAPIVRQRRLDAPSVAPTLVDLPRALMAYNLSDTERADVVARVLRNRQATVKPSDIEAEARAQIGRRPTPAVLAGDAGLNLRWPEAMAALRERIGPEQFNAWCTTLVPDSFNGRLFVVATHQRFIGTHVEQQFAAPLRVAVQTVWPDATAVDVRVKQPAREAA